MKPAYIMIPVELALFSLASSRMVRVRPVQTFLASKFVFYSGKARKQQRPAKQIAEFTGVSERTVYRHFSELFNWNWIGYNHAAGWYHFRGFNRIHKIENWQFARAAVMYPKDLDNFKEYLAGVVCASLAITGRRQRSEPKIGRTINGSEPPAASISLSSLSNILGLSINTAQRLRSSAAGVGYIKNKQSYAEVLNWTPAEFTELKKQDLIQLPVKLKGNPTKRFVSIDRIRYRNNKLFLQEPNIVKSLIPMGRRRGLSCYAPKP